MPKELDGKYTSETLARRAIEDYLERQGVVNERKKAKEEIQSIIELDHEKFDDDEDELNINL